MRGPTATGSAVLAAATLVIAGCSSAPDPQTQSVRDYVKEVTGDDLKVGFGLWVTIRSAVSDGRTIRISGVIENRNSHKVEGVRYTVRFMAAGDTERVLDTIYKESPDTMLDPGEHRAMRVEIENFVHATAPGRFTIEADPIRLGGQDVAPPPGWK